MELFEVILESYRVSKFVTKSVILLSCTAQMKPQDLRFVSAENLGANVVYNYIPLFSNMTIRGSVGNYCRVSGDRFAVRSTPRCLLRTRRTVMKKEVSVLAMNIRLDIAKVTDLPENCLQDNGLWVKKRAPQSTGIHCNFRKL